MSVPFVGNQDFRGYLNYLYQNGDQTAGTLIGAGTGGLGGVDNSGQINGTWLENAIQGPDTHADQEQAAKSNYINYVANAYKNYQSLSSGGGGGDNTDAAAKADEAAYWGDQIGALQRLLQSTETQKGQGLSNIESGYNTSVDRTKQQESQGLRDYATKREDTTNDKVAAFGNIDTKARNAYDSLMRVLGLGNAGVSSAAQIVAPTAVSREATQQRTSTNQTFGRNIRNIDTAEGDFKIKVANALADLLTQKNSKTEDFLRGILEQEASTNQSLSDAITQKAIAEGGSYRSAAGARAPYQAKVSGIQSTLDNLFNQYKTPAFQTADVQPTAPDLSQYLVDPIKVAAANANPGVDPSLLPYFASLKEKDNPLALL